MMNLKAFVLVGGIALMSCASPPPVGGPGLQVTTLGQLPPPTTVNATGERSYQIGPFDKLQIRVFGLEELTSEVQVDSSGKLSMPLAGTVQAGGRTPTEVADEISRRLRESYVKNPLVSVNLVEAVSQVVTVDGEVEKPGMYPVIREMTLMRAIAGAEGATDFAKLEDVVIFRTVGDQRMAGVYNLEAIRRGNYEDPEVYADDVIIVGESATRRLFGDVLRAAPAIVTPLVYVLTR